MNDIPKAAGRFRVRHARDTDVPAMGDLLDALIALEADFEQNRGKQRRGLTALLQLGAERSAVLVAEERGELIGMATGQVVVSTAEGGPVGLVEDLIVREDRRGRGVGRMLLETMEGWARQQGLKRLQLLADAGNRAALSFCEHIGWQPTRLVARRKYPA